MSNLKWPRVLAGGVLWMVVYNLVWGVAWFAFMRREWTEAMAAVNRPMPFTPEVWGFCVAMSLPIGVLIVAYIASRAPSTSAPKAAMYAGAALWLLMTLGMAGWGWQESHPIRIIAMDALVNLVAMLTASLASAWSQRET